MKNIRSCIACKNKFNKISGNLIKITKKADKIFINDSLAFGRSCYVCNNNDCIEKVVKNKLISKAFKTQIDNSVYEELLNFKR